MECGRLEIGMECGGRSDVECSRCTQQRVEFDTQSQFELATG
jgi:hypothetical protein